MYWPLVQCTYPNGCPLRVPDRKAHGQDGTRDRDGRPLERIARHQDRATLQTEARPVYPTDNRRQVKTDGCIGQATQLDAWPDVRTGS